MHSVTDRRTDGQTDDMMMPIADHTVQQYDRLTNKLNKLRSPVLQWLRINSVYS